MSQPLNMTNFMNPTNQKINTSTFQAKPLILTSNTIPQNVEPYPKPQPQKEQQFECKRPDELLTKTDKIFFGIMGVLVTLGFIFLILFITGVFNNTSNPQINLTPVVTPPVP